jgi:hypothetical protein
MGGGAFIRLKTGRGGPESAKQAEIGLASLFKILRICRRGEKSAGGAGKCIQELSEVVLFQRIWLIPGETHAV